MVQSTNGSQYQSADTFFVDPMQKRTQLLFTKQMHERHVFMQDLKEYRKGMEKQAVRTVRQLIGPRWYQVLSVVQRQALDGLQSAIYEDLLEGHPFKTRVLIKKLGIYPQPNNNILMLSNQRGADDAKKMLAEMFFQYYGHSIEARRSVYSLNARIILSSIFYLGLQNLIELLYEQFKPDNITKPPRKTKRISRPSLPSPYLEKTIIPMWCPASPKIFKPEPLPNLDKLNEPYTAPVIKYRKPSPPPPPPPPPNKRVSKTLCEKLANMVNIHPTSQMTSVMMKSTTTNTRKQRHTNVTIEIKKKRYGICITGSQKNQSGRKRVKVPLTGLNNTQYLIEGTFVIGGRKVYVLGNVSVTPPEGNLIHGGYVPYDSGYLNIHCGYQGKTAPTVPDACDCLKKWQEKVFKYVKDNKCYCGHNYDYGNEGTFPPDEIQFFQKPTANAPYEFNYHTIFDIDEKQLLVKKEFKKIWETDSVIGSKKDMVVKKKEKRRSSKTCLGTNPKPGDYLKCALRLMGDKNIAARLPNVDRTPELREWMRRRIYGPYSADQRQDYLRQTDVLLTMLDDVMHRRYSRVISNATKVFHGASNWTHSRAIRKKFMKYAEEFRRRKFQSLADINNIFWRIMFVPEFPDKKFREIFFSYQCGSLDDFILTQPYSSLQTLIRQDMMLNRRYVCLPDGIENLDCL